MNKAIFILLMVCSSFELHAQKLFSTKTGQIKFNASSPLEQIQAVNNQVDSKMIDNTGQLVISVLIKSFKFENQLMEDHFNENYMESSKFPKADFKGFITNIASINYAKDGKYEAKFDGTLTIHGVSKKVSTTGDVVITNGVPTISGTFNVKLADYNVTGSYIGGKIANEAAISINCKYQ